MTSVYADLGSIQRWLSQIVMRWENATVPMLSLNPPLPSEVAAGNWNAQITQMAQIIKVFVSGPDLTYGTNDDRRLFIRLAWEANGNFFPYSPCHAFTQTARDYRQMWKVFHDRFAAEGIERTRLAWIYSVWQNDSPCTDTNNELVNAKTLYPGDQYVDWVGIDGYGDGTSEPNQVPGLNLSPANTFGPMKAELRQVSSKPLSIDEVGVNPSVSGGKAAWINSYFAWIRANDVRMSTWFNWNRRSTYAVLDTPDGNETCIVGLRCWAQYRQGLANAWMVGPDRPNPRLITDKQFLGED